MMKTEIEIIKRKKIRIEDWDTIRRSAARRAALVHGMIRGGMPAAVILILSNIIIHALYGYLAQGNINIGDIIGMPLIITSAVIFIAVPVFGFFLVKKTTRKLSRGIPDN